MNRMRQTAGYCLALWVSSTVSVSAFAAPPAPDIKLNGIDTPLSIVDTDNLQLSLSLDAGEALDTDADWWLVDLTPSSQTSYSISSGLFETGLTPGLQAALFSFPSLSLLTLSGLSTETHDLCFAVDTIRNGTPDWEVLYFDCARVDVIDANRLIRDFTLPTPLFSADSAWRQNASSAATLTNSDDIITATYRVLRGDQTNLIGGSAVNWPFIELNHDEYSVPIFRAGTQTAEINLCDYEGFMSWPNGKYSGDFSEGGPVSVPMPAGTVRPGGPLDIEADGWLVLYDANSGMEYDFWQATTSSGGPCQSHGGGYLGTTISEAGYTDFFDTSEEGSNPDGIASARAVGTPLLAGLLLPEDITSGSIEHSLAFAIPGPRNLGSDPSTPDSSDYTYPAATTETDFYSRDNNAMIAGQRIRLKDSIVNGDGETIDESTLSPITQTFLTALRDYGAIMVDNAGGFIFYAEDIHTGNLQLSDDQVNNLIGQPAGTQLPAGKSKWQIVLETLHEELSEIPIAYGPWNDDDTPADAAVSISNFDVVTSPTQP